MDERDPEPMNERVRLERHVDELAQERAALFDKAGATFGLSKDDQQRLKAVELELDECFLERRRLRAHRDVIRFDREQPSIRRHLPPPSPS